ncbi:MAG: class I mannose-6-phosphate isomerase [Chloroflexota bacterium]
MSGVYPMLIRPRFDERIWGGDRLASALGKQAPAGKPVGESWEIFDENTVLNGEYAGQSLSAVRQAMGEDLMGHVPAEAPFPMLTKLIDAHDVLSVQVHPDDRFAQELEGQPNGKTECWYVLAVDAGATLVYGFARDTDPDEYEALVKTGTLDTLLRSIEVMPGDVVYIPAGTVHAIGAGVLLYELQQTSDITYRIYDWNRRDTSGHERELHVDKAKQVLNYHRATHGTVRPLHRAGSGRSTLVGGEYFCEELLEAGVVGAMSTNNSPVALCTLGRPVAVWAGRSEPVNLAPYSSLVIPAAAGSYTLEPSGDDSSPAVVLASYVPASRASTFRDLRAQGFSSEEVETFLGQFEPASDLGQAAR